MREKLTYCLIFVFIISNSLLSQKETFYENKKHYLTKGLALNIKNSFSVDSITLKILRGDKVLMNQTEIDIVQKFIEIQYPNPQTNRQYDEWINSNIIIHVKFSSGLSGRDTSSFVEFIKANNPMSVQIPYPGNESYNCDQVVEGLVSKVKKLQRDNKDYSRELSILQKKISRLEFQKNKIDRNILDSLSNKHSREIVKRDSIIGKKELEISKKNELILSSQSVLEEYFDAINCYFKYLVSSETPQIRKIRTKFYHGKKESAISFTRKIKIVEGIQIKLKHQKYNNANFHFHVKGIGIVDNKEFSETLFKGNEELRFDKSQTIFNFNFKENPSKNTSGIVVQIYFYDEFLKQNFLFSNTTIPINMDNGRIMYRKASTNFDSSVKDRSDCFNKIKKYHVPRG